MSSGSFKQVYVQCPFYKTDDGRRQITCEGICDGCNMTLSFKSKSDWEKQIDVFCSEHYRKCEVYRMLMEKYQE